MNMKFQCLCRKEMGCVSHGGAAALSPLLVRGVFMHCCYLPSTIDATLVLCRKRRSLLCHVLKPNADSCWHSKQSANESA